MTNGRLVVSTLAFWYLASCAVADHGPGVESDASAIAAPRLAELASESLFLHHGVSVGFYNGAHLMWDQCSGFDSHTEYIFLEDDSPLDCGGGTTVYGFVALTNNPNPSPTTESHTIEVCDFIGPSITMTVDPAKPDGSSSGNLLTYTDLIGGGCNKPAPKGYPFRKFLATWGGGLPSSDWDAPF